MNDDQLRALLKQTGAQLRADPQAGERAWGTAIQQERRQRLTIVAGCAVAAALVTAVVANPPNLDRSAPPATTASATEPAPATISSTEPPPALPSVSFEEQLREVVQPSWSDVKMEQLPLLDTELPRSLDPSSQDASPLSQDPVRIALAVAQLPSESALDIRVLGDDQRWRQLDTSELEPSFGDSSVVSMIDGSPLSPDGRELALAGPDTVTVVDLTNGSTQSFALPPNDVPHWVGRQTKWSPDGSQIMVGPARGGGYKASKDGILIDMQSGDVLPVPYDATQAAFAPDGVVYELRDPGYGVSEVRRYFQVESGPRPDHTITVQIHLFDVTPAVSDVMAVSRAVLGWTPPRGIDDQNGILVIDPATGEPLAQLPMKDHEAQATRIHGWLDPDTLIFSTFDASVPDIGADYVAWNYQSGVLSRLTALATVPSDISVALAVDQLR